VFPAEAAALHRIRRMKEIVWGIVSVAMRHDGAD